MRETLRALLIAGILICSAGVLEPINGAEPLVTLSSTALNFRSQPIGMASPPQEIALTNSGAAPLTIAEIAVTGENKGDFFQANNCPASPATLAAGASCIIQVTFKPSSAGGTLTAALSISDNASGSPQTVQLRGDAVPPVPVVALSPPTLAFGNQAIGSSSSPRVVTLTNRGSAVLHITTPIVLAGNNAAEFALVPSATTCPASGGEVPPKVNCTIGVRFQPASLGEKNAQVTIIDDAAGSPHGIPLSGIGAAP